MNISVSGELTTIPALLEDYTPNFGGLPFFLLRLATQVSIVITKLRPTFLAVNLSPRLTGQRKRNVLRVSLQKLENFTRISPV